MSPRKASQKQTVRNALPSIRRSSRIAARLAVINTNVERRHRGHKASTTNCTIKNPIPSLNDDCLLAIFSFLSLMELFELRKCCHRFKALADITAPKQCRRETFHYIYKLTAHEEILQCYGSYMQNVVLERICEIDRLFTNEPATSKFKWKWLGHCKALKSLTIRKMHLGYDELIAKIIDGLENLELDGCSFENEQYELIIPACKNLKSFSISNCRLLPKIFDCLAKLESIEKISIPICLNYFNRYNWFAKVAIFRALPKLKCLELELRGNGYNLEEIIESICEIDTLEHLVLYVLPNPDRYQALEYLNALANLKTCQIHFSCRQRYFDVEEFRGAMERFDVDISRNTGDFHIVDYDIKLQRKN